MSENNVVEKELLYDGFHKIKKVSKKLGEKELEAEVLIKDNTVSGLVYNTVTKKYIFVEKYRVAAEGITVEVVNGKIEEGEKESQAIKRVVTEVTGYKVDDIKTITSYFMDTDNSSEVCSLFYVEVSDKVIEDLGDIGYNLIEVERLGLGGKLFVQDPVNMMVMDNTNKEKKIIPPYQSIDAKSLIAIMWVENNNTLKEMAELITNSKIRSL
jgi:8-oxo-dGTP pyrophosphatase MutT (NUDIX family)